MNRNPLVSVIIPTYNRATLIAETLESIQKQTYQNWECLVIDDGSTDDTQLVVAAFAKRDARFQFHVRPDTHKPGGNGARNYGYTLSKGEYINWFDSDDLMHPEKIEKQVALLEKSSHNFVVCQTLIFQDTQQNVLGLRHEKITSSHTLLDFVKQDIVFLTQAPLIKKSFFLRYNLLFDEELKAAQEWEFFVRVLYHSPDYLVTDSPWVYVRKHTDSISYKPEKQSERRWHYYLARQKALDFFALKDFADKKAVMDYLKWYQKDQLKKSLFGREFKKSLKIYKSVLKHNRAVFSNIKIGFYMVFVFCTGKGYKYRDFFIQ